MASGCSRFHLGRRTVLVGLSALLGVVVVVVVLQNVGGSDGFGLISADASSSYLGVALLVFLDAVCPVFPGETTLNAASTLASQGTLDLPLVILAGAVGAIVGDSALYWMARLFSTRLQKQVERARQNDKVAEALGFFGDSAPLLLIAGRFVPGVRFVVNATLGMEKTPTGGFSSGPRSEVGCEASTPACLPTRSEQHWRISHSRPWSSRG